MGEEGASLFQKQTNQKKYAKEKKYRGQHLKNEI